MIVALTGTPGIGKTSAANILRKKGYLVAGITKIVTDEDFLIGNDEKRNSKVVDIDILNKYIEKNYLGEEIVIIDGHLSHLLKCVNKIVVLRCHPDILRERLTKKGWGEEKIKENLEAEILDVILCETIEVHSKKNIFEINTTKNSIDEVVLSILDIIENKFKKMKKYNIGNIDWSEEILNDF